MSNYSTLLLPSPEIRFEAPGPHPNGMQATAEGLWVLDQADNRLHLMSYDGVILRDLATDADRGSGVTHTGDALWIASTYNCQLMRIDPQTGTTLAAYPSPGADKTGSHGLEWRDGKLWVATPPSATVYQVDPDDGCRVLRSFAAPGNRPHGIAWHGNDLWLVETNHRAIYLMATDTGAIKLKLELPADAPEPHGMTVWDGAFWYCDADTRVICTVPIPR